MRFPWPQFGRSGLRLLLYIVPVVNVVVAVGVARAFGEDGLYGSLLPFLCQCIGYLVPGFGSAQYTEIRR